MQYLYIDESGSMTTEHANSFPYFVICVLRVFDKEKLKRKIKLFISKNIQLLKSLDDSSKIFKNGKFRELKGSALSHELKIKLANYMMKYCSNYFEVHIIKINNKSIRPETYQNTARAFNYFIDLFLTRRFRENSFPNDEYFIQIDERNTKTNAQKTLEDYLYIELSLKYQLLKSVTVTYQDSCNNVLIQLSDFFSNLYYSYLMQKESYKNIISKMKQQKILADDFTFPVSDYD